MPVRVRTNEGWPRIGRAVLLASAFVTWLTPPSEAGIFGIPTNLNAIGTTSAATTDPPGYLTIAGPTFVPGGGDAVHQVRLFIEVSGPQLDIRIFDAGTSGARDHIVGSADTTTTYTLLNPTGGTIQSLSITNDNGTTENRLARYSSTGAFTAANGGLPFATANAGLYELRISTTSAGSANDFNTLGVEIRDGAGNHYNVYTLAGSDAATGVAAASETAMIVGALNTATIPGTIAQPLVFYPYVNRGCHIATSNYDGDNPGAGATGSITDMNGALTALTLSGGTVHAEDNIFSESQTAVNLESTNYGMYTLVNNTGSQFNVIDWRVADFTSWANNPAALPRNPNSAIRNYLPNGYVTAGASPNATLSSATAPGEPILASSTRVVSGSNPPTAGQTTRFLITATVENCAVRNAADASICDVPTQASTNVQITIPELPAVAGPTGVSYTYVAGSQAGFIDGAAAACVDGSGAGFRRCTFAALGAGSAASLNIEVDVTLGASATGLKNLTGPPATGSPPPNTTVWAQYTPAFSSAMFPRTETLGPVCNLIFDVGGSAIATRASIRGLRVNRAGVVEFATGTQQETAAFNVYGVADRQGRAARSLLNASPVAAPVASSLTPVLYRVDTAPVAWPYLLIEEIDRRGRRHFMGPYAVDDRRLAGAFERIEAHMDQAGTVRQKQARLVMPGRSARLAEGRARERMFAPVPSTHGIKIEVSQAGPVQVPLLELQAQGLPPETPASRLRLTNLGQDVPFQLVAGADGTPEAILFQAEALSTDYTGRNVYVLTWRRRPSMPSAALTRSEDPELEGFTRAEKNWLYVANAPEGTDPWLWDLLFGDGSTWPYGDPEAGRFDLPDLAAGASGPVPVRIRLVGRTTHVHTVEARINGALVGSLTFQGAAPALLTGTVPAEQLLSGENELTLTYSAEVADPDDLGLVYLNYLELQVATSPAAFPVPYALRPYDPGLPELRDADYLVVTHAQFRDAAERIAGLKTSEGLRAAVVDVERAYDRFSAGVVEANAVRELIRSAGARYVLLVGDDTFDGRDYLGTGAVSYVPSLLAWDGEFGRVPSENRYADLDGNGTPELAIGRLTAQSVAEAEALADKIAAQASSLRQSAGRHLFAVDNQAPGDISFRGQAEAAAALLPPGSSVTWADIGADGIDAARATLLSGLGSGAMVTHYFGHAGPEMWADESLLNVEDAAALAGSGRQTLLFAWACESQWYQNLFGPTVNEAMLLAPQGGALASFGPAGVSDPSLQNELLVRVYAYFFAEGLSLGEAIQRAKADAVLADPRTRKVAEGWNLLGDPALRLDASAAGRASRGRP